MANQDYGTRTTYIGDGATRVYPLPFPIMDAADICVEVDGVAAPFTYNEGMGTLVLDTAPAVGIQIQIIRETSVEAPLHEFADQYVLKQTELDENFEQQGNALQELKDVLDEIETDVDYTWDNITGKPTEFPPEAHTHVEADITDLDKYTQAQVDAALAGKADSAHTHVEADITDLDKYTQAQVDAALATKIGDAPADGNQYARKDNAWEQVTGGGGATAIDDLTDVDTSTTPPTDGQALVWDSANSQWEPGDVAAGGGGGVAAGAAPSKVLIEKIDLTTGGEFDFNNIPQDYDRLVLVAEVRGDISGTEDATRLYINDDLVDANYHCQPHFAHNGSNYFTESNSPYVGEVPAATAPAGSHGRIELGIENYTSSRLKMVRADFDCYLNTDNARTGHMAVTSALTAAVTRLRLRADGHPTNGLTGTAYLYGERAISIEDSETVTVKQQVETITNTAAGVFDFQDIPQDGDRLVIEGLIKSDVVGTAKGIVAYLNADTTATNYHHQRAGAFDGLAEVSEGNSAICGVVTGTTSAVEYATFRLIVENYTNAAEKVMRCEYSLARASGEVENCTAVVISSVTAALDRVRIQTNDTPTTDLLGSLTCYIEKQGVLPVIPETDVAATAQTEGLILIEEITNTTGGDFDFTSIPPGFDSLILEGTVRGDSAVTNDAMYMYFNGDFTDANYHGQNIRGYNGGVLNSETAYPFIANVVAASGPSNSYSQIRIDVLDPDGSHLKTAQSSSNAYESTDAMIAGTCGITSSVSAAVSRITLRTDGHPTDGITGTVRLYGRKSLTIQDSETISTKVLVGEVIDPTAGYFDFDLTNFQDGDTIVLEGSVRSNRASAQDFVELYFNGDLTGTNYHHQLNGAVGGATSVGYTNLPHITEASAASAPADMQGDFTTEIHGYALSGKRKGAVSRGGAGTNVVSNVWATSGFTLHGSLTDPITSLRVAAHQGTALTGRVRCYIIKQGVLPLVTDADAEVTSTTLTRAAGMSLPNSTWTTILWDTPIKKTGTSLYSPPATDRMTAPKEGWYDIIFGVGHDGASATAQQQYHQIQVYNGAGVLQETFSARHQTVFSGDVVVTGRQYMEAGWYVTCRVYQQHGARTSANEFFSMSLDESSGSGVLTLEGTHEIETITDPGTGEFDFNNIPPGFRRLILKGALRSTGTGGNDPVLMFFNDDLTATNYDALLQVNNAGSASDSNINAPRIGYATAASSPSGAYGTLECQIEDYAGTSIKQLHAESLARTSATTGILAATVKTGHRSMTAAITRLRVRTDGHATDTLTGTLTLYGEY